MGSSRAVVDPRVRIVRSENLSLVPQMAEHADSMFAVLSDPALYEYENEPPTSAEWLRERFARLESRESADGRERWLNWVIQLPSGELVGYVQATLDLAGEASIAYILSSRHWGKGFASEAVRAMIRELSDEYGARGLTAVLKGKNHRSLRLLERLHFSPAPTDDPATKAIDPDEIRMTRSVVEPRKDRG